MSQNHTDMSGENSPFYGVCRTGENNPMYGRHHTEDTKEKLRQANKGKPSPMKNKHHTEETKDKISKAHQGKCVGENNPMYGISPKERMDEETYKQWLINQKENAPKGENHPMYGKNGVSSPVSKPIYCLELNEMFWGGKDAEYKYQINGCNISLCCNGKVKSAGKHPETAEKLHWFFIEDKTQKDGDIIHGAISIGYVTQQQVEDYLNNLRTQAQ